jgi:unsaturated chondroitin disaccharide hydrolase
VAGSFRAEKLLEKEQFNKGTHDLGFMMFCSFGNANRLMHTKETMRF